MNIGKGDDPIQDEKTKELMTATISTLDRLFNGEDGAPPRYGLVLFVMDLNLPPGVGRTNYMATIRRDDAKSALKEVLQRWEK